MKPGETLVLVLCKEQVTYLPLIVLPSTAECCKPMSAQRSATLVVKAISFVTVDLRLVKQGKALLQKRRLIFAMLRDVNTDVAQQHF